MRTYVRVDHPPPEAAILHADADCFFASVEQRDNPRLRGKPVIVGGGVVLAASYEARAFGVKGAMGGATARRLCPHAIVVNARMEAYSAASKEMFAVFNDTSPAVEGLSIDEAFIDVRGMRRIAGSPPEIAARLRREMREKVGIPITIGVARTKFLAKVASGVAKPDGLLVVPPGGELAFLHPLPVEALWGVGPVTAREAPRARDPDGGGGGAARPSRRSSRWSAARPAASCTRWPTTATRGGSRRAARRRSIGSQRALGRRPRPPAALDATLVAIVDRLGKRLRDARRVVPHGRPAAALRRLLARDAVAHDGRGDRPHAASSSPSRATCSPPRGR